MSIRILLIAGLISWHLLFSALVSVAEDKPSGAMVILPFSVSATADSYLANGIRDMLASRLAALGVRTLRHKPGTKIDANAGAVANFQKIMAQFSAAYLLVGRYKHVDNGVEITALVYSANSKKIKEFLRKPLPTGEVIKAIDHLAEDIGLEIFGKITPRSESAERLGMVEEAPSGILSLPAGYSHNGRPRSGLKRQPLFTESPAINLHLRSLGVGDLDGDGVDELVVAGPHKIMAFKIRDGNFKKIAEFTGSLRADIVYISMGDLNHDGRQEIYVSVVAENGPESFALRWQGKAFDYLVKDVPYYLRVMRMIDGKLVLIGEKDSGLDFEPAFYVMRLKGDRLYATSRLDVNAPVTIFNFSLADLDDDRQAEIISRPRAGHLQIMSSSGRELWSRKVGSDDLSYGVDNVAGHGNDSGRLSRLEMAGRIIVRNLDGVVGPEFISNEGLSLKDGELEMHKKIHLFTWTGRAPKELWHTEEIDDEIADYQLGSFQAHGTMLYIGVNMSRGIMDIMASDQCRILMYPIVLGTKAEGL